MALEDILAAIRADADADRARVAAESEQACLVVAADADREAEAVTREIVDRATGRAEAEARATERAARREAAMSRLHAREHMIVSLLNELTEGLDSQREAPHYAQLLDRLIGEAVAALPDAKEAHVDPRDALAVKALLAGNTHIVVIADVETAGGVVLDNLRGGRVIHTLEARLEALADELRRIAVEIHPALAQQRKGAATPNGS